MVRYLPILEQVDLFHFGVDIHGPQQNDYAKYTSNGSVFVDVACTSFYLHCDM